MLAVFFAIQYSLLDGTVSQVRAVICMRAMEAHSKYLLQCAENASIKPIASIDVFASLDDEFLVAGSSDKNLRFIDTDSLEEIAKYAVDKKSVNCVCVSGIGLNGQDPVIVTGGKDSSIQIWNPVCGTLERTIKLPTKEVKAIAMYRGSESYIMLGTKDARVLVWDFTTNTLAASFEGHKGSVYTVSITSAVDMCDINGRNDIDALCLASGSTDRTARTWSLRKLKKKRKLRHPWAVYTLVVSNTGPRPIMVCAGADPSLKIWDAHTGVLLRTLEGHHHRVNHIALWEGFQMLIVTASADHTIRVYDVVTGECVALLLGHKDIVLRVAIAGSVPKIISSSDDMSIMQWDLQAIIDDHYRNDGDDVGMRREDAEPYLPEYNYVLPLFPVRDPRATVVSRSATGESQGSERQVSLESIAREASKEDSVQPPSPAEATSATTSPSSGGSGSFSPSVHGRVAPAEALEPGEVIVKAPASSLSMARRASLNLVHNIMGIMKNSGQEQDEASQEDSEKRMKNKAAATLSTFKVAQVEQELSAEKQRQEAADNLAKRLKKKRQQGGQSEHDESSQRTSLPETKNSADDELETLKAEKLRQHQRQEQRSRQSMSLAKGRAAIALQRRLEEMAKRKLSTPVDDDPDGGNSDDDSN